MSDTPVSAPNDPMIAAVEALHMRVDAWLCAESGTEAEGAIELLHDAESLLGKLSAALRQQREAGRAEGRRQLADLAQRIETSLMCGVQRVRGDCDHVQCEVAMHIARELRELAADAEALPAPAESDMICEQHPELLWPHGDCAGPGCPLLARERLTWAKRRDLQQSVLALEGMVQAGAMRIRELEVSQKEAVALGKGDSSEAVQYDPPRAEDETAVVVHGQPLSVAALPEPAPRGQDADNAFNRGTCPTCGSSICDGTHTRKVRA